MRKRQQEVLRYGSSLLTSQSTLLQYGKPSCTTCLVRRSISQIEERQNVEIRIRPTRTHEHRVGILGTSPIPALGGRSTFATRRGLISNHSTLLIFPAAMLLSACAFIIAIRKQHGTENRFYQSPSCSNRRPRSRQGSISMSNRRLWEGPCTQALHATASNGCTCIPITISDR